MLLRTKQDNAAHIRSARVSSNRKLQLELFTSGKTLIYSKKMRKAVTSMQAENADVFRRSNVGVSFAQHLVNLAVPCVHHYVRAYEMAKNTPYVEACFRQDWG